MLITEDTLPWLAGIVEGEGCIGAWTSRVKSNGKTYSYATPRINVAMTDWDIVKRVAKLFGTAPRLTEKSRGGIRKPMYVTAISGKPALSLMFDLFPYLGKRRRAKISETLSKWEHS